MFLFRAPPQFLYQAPPGAQQLSLPDLAYVPHVGHAIILVIVAVNTAVRTDVVIDFLATSSRSGND